MRTLFLKELRALLPAILFLAALEILGNGSTFVTEFPDQQVFTDEVKEDGDIEASGIYVAIMALLLGSGLLVRERDDGTLGFLDALPVRRSAIFTAKTAAALTVFTGVLCFDTVAMAVLHAISRDSTEAWFPAQLFAAFFGLNWLMGWTFLAAVTALSFLRRWLFLVLGIIVWLYLLARQIQIPHVEMLNPFALGKPAMHEGVWIIPWRLVGVQTGVALVASAVSLLGFQMLGERAARVVASRWARVLGVLGLILIPIVWLSLLVYMAINDRSTHPKDLAASGRQKPITLATTHYAFLYRPGQSDAISELSESADEIYDTVAGFLGVPPGPAAIVVDITSRLARHNAGQAYWKKIRMEVNPDDDGNNVAVLGHETAHVLLEQMAEFRLTPHFDSVRFFHEGLASYVEHRFFHTPEETREFRRTAAAIHAIAPVSFELLAENQKLVRTHSKDLVYPLGELWVKALVETCGEEAPAKVARALARPDAPKGLKHADYWQEALQACGYSLERIIGAWQASLERLVAEESAFLKKLPRLTAKLESVGDEILIRPAYDGPAPGKLLCQVRPHAAAADFECDFPEIGDDGNFRVPRSGFERGLLSYQLGWLPAGAPHPLWETWQEAPMPK